MKYIEDVFNPINNITEKIIREKTNTELLAEKKDIEQLKKQLIIQELDLYETKVSRTEEEIIKKLNIDMSTEGTGITEYPNKKALIARKEALRTSLRNL